MKKLDWYIIRKFLGTFFFIMGLIMLLAVVFDISERFEDFAKTKPPVSAIIFDYYQNFVYFYSNVFSSLIIFIAVIFFTSKLAQNSEVIAMLSSGVSFPRFLRPYIISATVLTLLSLYTNHMVLPHANKRMIEFEARYVWNKPSYTRVHREMEKGLFAFISSYTEGNVDNIWIEKWDGKKLNSVFYALRARCDSTNNRWTFYDYFERDIYDNHEVVRKGPKKDSILSFGVKDFGLRTEYAATMNSFDLYRYIQQERQRGNEEIVNYEIELNQRSSFPVATYILTIIAVCVSCRRSRGGLGLNLTIGLMVAVLYIFCMKITSVAATNAGMPPIIAVWIPNIMFALIAIFFYRWARR
jgi:lipopolysaccharide export system permease protein